MTYFEWDTALETGNQMIDDQHRSLHERLTGEVLRNMAAYFNGESVAATQIAPLVTDWLRTHIAEQDMAFVRWSTAQ